MEILDIKPNEEQSGQPGIQHQTDPKTVRENYAQDIKRAIEAKSRECRLIHGDVKDGHFCKNGFRQTVDKFGKLNILVNTAAMLFPAEKIEVAPAYVFFVSQDSSYMKGQGLHINGGKILGR